MRKRIIGSLVAAFLLLSTQTAFAATYTMAGYDGEESGHDWSTNHFFAMMQGNTGTSFEFSQYNNAEKWQEAKDAMFASGDLPDVLFKAALTTDELITYSDKGQLIDLLPLLAENAPNLWALLLENPEWLAAITLPNGKVAALPTINLLSLQNTMWINQTWLEKLNLDKPTDWESLLAVLTAFQTKDPNQNGKSDEIPLSFLGPWDLKFLSHAFGMVANDYNIYVDDAGQVQFLPLQEDYLAFLKALVSLNEQGLLDENGFTTADSLRTESDSDATVTYGMFFGPNPYNLLAIDLGEQYTMLPPLRFEGKQIYRDLFGPITTGTYAITSACENPADLLRWVDLLYSQEGAIMAMVGAEGENYTWNDDGTWAYSADLEADTNYLYYDLSIYDTGNMPWLFPVEFYTACNVGNLQTTSNSLAELTSYLVDPFPYYYVLSAQQRDLIDPLQLALGQYVDQSIAKFILGELDIHSQEDVQAFYDGLAERGVDDFIAFWQGVYDQQAIR